MADFFVAAEIDNETQRAGDNRFIVQTSDITSYATQPGPKPEQKYIPGQKLGV